MDQFAKETLTTSIEEEMRHSYLNYAMSVIIGRALPDVRDGLKPVHRRSLFAMYELSNDWNRAYKKSARIVGDVIGKYHPHGDSAVYETIVRMAQNFSLRYMLVDGQGNFGSIDGDNAAAMRYTEIRIAKIGHELLSDIDKETVDFIPNYDNSEIQPIVLPARIPNLLINGSSGIAVGMATNIPPHNLREVVDACQFLLKIPEATIDELMEIIPGPDFPTAAIIYGVDGVYEGYRTGRGRVIMRAATHFEEIDRSQRTAIIIDELPYQVNKRCLIERITNLANDKKLEGISDIRDESDKSGMRVVIELRRGQIAEVVLNNLYKTTQLQDTFGINMVALVGGQPKLLNLKEILQCFLSHRREVLTRRTIYELHKGRERAHVLEGLTVALANIDIFIELIKFAATPPIAKQKLITRSWDASLVRDVRNRSIYRRELYCPEELNSAFGMQADNSYCLSDIQVQEILQMRLQRLTSLEQNKIIEEYCSVMKHIADLLDILSNPDRITMMIHDELTILKDEFGDVRRSKINPNTFELNTEDLIVPQDMVVIMTHTGYVKSQPLSEYRAQKRGGRGKQGTKMKDNDWIETIFIANTHDSMLFFSNRGRVYLMKVHEIPQSSRNSKGQPIVNMFLLQEGEKINVLLPVKEFSSHKFVFMATSLGIVKKIPIEAFSRPLKRGIIAVSLNDNDYLIGADITDGTYDVMLFSDIGKAVRFDENCVRPMGRDARGVRGMQLKEHQRVIALLVAPNNKNQSVLTATENGYGKRTRIDEYTRRGRGTKGIISIKTSKRNGRVVAATLVDQKSQIMLTTTAGVLIRTRVSEVREMGRATQGVRLINVEKGSKLSSIQKVKNADTDKNFESKFSNEIN